MSEIPISIVIRQVGAEEVASKIQTLSRALSELTAKSEALQRPLASVTRSARVLGRGVSTSFARMSDAMTKVGENVDALTRFDNLMGEIGPKSEKIGKAFSAINKSLGYSPELWNNLRSAVSKAGEGTAENIRIINEAERAYREIAPYTQRFGVSALDAARIFRRGANSVQLQSFQMVEALEAAREITRKYGVTVRMTPENVLRAVRGMNTFRETMMRMNLSVEEGIQRYPRLFNILISGGDASGEVMRQLQMGTRQLTMGLHLLSRQLFWIGLGTMFLTMSWDRLQRRQMQLRRMSLTYVRTLLRLQEAQENLRDIIKEYGAGSEEAIRATRRFRLTQEQARLDLEMTRAQVREIGLAWMMFFTSAVGQAIGAGAMVRFAMFQIAQGTLYATEASNLMGILYPTNMAKVAGSTLGAVGPQMMFNAAQEKGFWELLKYMIGLKQLQAVLGVTTGEFIAASIGANLFYAAITLGISAISSFALSQILAQQQMAEFEKETKRLQREIGITVTGRSPGLVDLVNKFGELRIRVEAAGREVIHSERAFRTLQRAIKPVTIPPPMARTSNINIGPIVIRGGVERGIDRQKLISDLRREMLNTLKASGVA